MALGVALSSKFRFLYAYAETGIDRSGIIERKKRHGKMPNANINFTVLYILRIQYYGLYGIFNRNLGNRKIRYIDRSFSLSQLPSISVNQFVPVRQPTATVIAAAVTAAFNGTCCFAPQSAK